MLITIERMRLMKFKRNHFVSILLVMVMLFSFAACKGDANEGSATPKETDSGTQVVGGGTMQGEENIGSTSAMEGVTLNTDKVFAHGRVNPDESFENDKVSSKDTLVIRLNEDNGTLDTITSGSYNENGIIYSLTGSVLVTEGITKDGNLDFICNKYTLATRYEFDDDYMGLTFYIRDDAYFHNGDKVTVDDVAFSIARIEADGRFGYIDYPNIKADPVANTVYVPFKTVRSTVLQLFGRFVHIFSKSLYQEYEARGDLNKFFYVCPGTTGMYEIKEWVSGDHVTLKADPLFFGGKPKIENVIVRFISDQTVAMLELETGGVDLVYEPAWNDVKNVLEGQYGDAITGFTDTQTLAMAVGYNLTGPCGDENLRMAIRHACDWNTIVKGAYDGLAVPAYTLVSSTQSYLRNCTDWYNSLYNPDLAKEYMAKSNYPNGVELVILNNGDPQKQICAEMMGSYLSQYGITLKIESYDTATYDAMMTGTEGWDLWMRDFGGTGNPAFSFTNFGAWIINTGASVAFPEEAAALNEIGQQLITAADPAVASALMENLQNEYFENDRWYWVQPVCQRIQYLLFTSNLKNFSYTSSYFYITDAYFE